MNNIKNFRNSRRNLFFFIFVMILNIGLGSFLISESIGQISDVEKQVPIDAKVKKQKDNPLKIILLQIDTSNSNYQTVSYTIENISNKEIIAYTIVGDKVNTVEFNIMPFSSGESRLDESFVETSKIKKDTKVSFFVDYVKFSNGTTWGNDTQEESMRLVGSIKGKIAALAKIRDLINQEDSNLLTKFLKQDITTLDIPLTEINKDKKWVNGYRRGYKSVIATLKNEKSTKSITEKINKMENVIKTAEKEADK